MIKAFMILGVLVGLLMFALICANAVPTDKDTYDAYMRWKEKKEKWKGQWMNCDINSVCRWK